MGSGPVTHLVICVRVPDDPLAPDPAKSVVVECKGVGDLRRGGTPGLTDDIVVGSTDVGVPSFLFPPHVGGGDPSFLKGHPDTGDVHRVSPTTSWPVTQM